jgi:Fe-S-cluster containining protein
MAKRYICDGCGLCCTQLIVEADPLDILREPAIAEKCPHLDGHGTIPIEESAWSIACGEARLCPFHQDKKCSIYPTRPNVCAEFQAGGAKCQELRTDHGLSALVAVEDDSVLARINEAWVRDEE